MSSRDLSTVCLSVLEATAAQGDISSITLDCCQPSGFVGNLSSRYWQEGRLCNKNEDISGSAAVTLILLKLPIITLAATEECSVFFKVSIVTVYMHIYLYYLVHNGTHTQILQVITKSQPAICNTQTQ